MVTFQLVKLLNRVESTIYLFVTGSRWHIKSSFVIIGAILFFAFPSLDKFSLGQGATWDAVQKKSATISYDVLDDYSAGTNASKVNFRLTAPVISNIFGLDAYGMYAIQVLAGIGIIFFSLSIAERLTNSRLFAFFVTLMIGSTYAGRTGFVESRGLFDAVAICFLLLPLRFQNPLVIFSSIFLSAWTDERGLIASSLILIFFLVQDCDRPGFSIRILFSPKLVAVFFAWIAYFAVRFAYAAHYGISTAYGGIGLSVLKNQINMIPMGMWTAFEGGWILVGYAVLSLFLARDYMKGILLTGSLAIILIVSLSVVDISRSTAYAVPAVFVALLILMRTEEVKHIKSVLELCLALSVAWPAYYAGGDRTIWWQYPLPFQVLRWLFVT